MANTTFPDDIPVDINGVVTDPLRAGFQILANYESTYWRALVGNDAWGLYEVLRSFCHADKDQKAGTCWPSINLLAAILGIKERRVLTGYQKVVHGKTYTYPGLIEILQQHDLLFAREEGEGPDMRYKFDVVLTPKLLTPDQLATLPPLLQQKHAELVERCRANLENLKATRRPARVGQPEAAPAPPVGGGSVNYRRGSGNLPGGSGNLPNPSGNLPIEQQQSNNTHNNNQRTMRAASPQNGTPAMPEDDAVVVALIERGLGKRVARQLVDQFGHDRIGEKLAFLDFLEEAHPDRIKNPRGWLRKAIEEDYGAPDGYLDPESRARAHAEEVGNDAWIELLLTAGQTEQARRQARLLELQTRHGATDEDRRLGEVLMAELKARHGDSGILRDLLPSMTFVKLEGTTAVFCVDSVAVERQLTHPGIRTAIQREVKFLCRDAPAFEGLKTGEIGLQFLVEEAAPAAVSGITV